MWQRFTERARRVILVAQEEAAAQGSGNVTSEHLLLAFFQEGESPAAQFLQSTGLTADAVRAATKRPASAATHPNGVPLSQEMKNLLTDSAQIAKHLGHHDIDSHHLLLALLSNPESEAATLLKPPQPTPQELYAGLLKQLKK